MPRLKVPLLVLVLVPLPFLVEIVISSSSVSPQSRHLEMEPLNLSKSLNSFSLDMYKELASKAPAENLFFSPLSVMSSLGMTLLGCRANTHAQLSGVLKISNSNEQIEKAFNKVIAKYKEVSPDYELRTANMMYVSDKLAIKEDYSNSLQTSFAASSKTVDFGGQSEAVRKEINSAVEKETNDRIKDLVAPGVLTSLTRLVLVNAVYFKGLWVNQFRKEDTQNLDFWTSETESVKTPMMHIKKKFQFKFLREIKASLLAMDYKGSNLTMVIVLPDERAGLAALEEKLNTIDIGTELKSLKPVELEVVLPKFKLEYDQELKESLGKLGAQDLFIGGKSDLSGIGSVPGDLYVSNVLHKAFVEVNEEGTEAAAATAQIMMTRMMVTRPLPPFKADHPFSFFIYDRELDMNLFAGRFVRPNSDSSKVEL